jgi:leucyl aminopeptidase
MPAKFDISFAKTAEIDGGTAVLLALADGSSRSGIAAADPSNALERAVKLTEFKAKSGTAVEVLAPNGSPADRLLLVGLGKSEDLTAHDWLKTGGSIAAKIGKKGKAVIFLDVPGLGVTGREAADLALGMLLRSYSFDLYKTKKAGSRDESEDADDAKSDKPLKVTVVTEAAAEAKKAFADAQAVAEGVIIARDLVNEPPNVLGPLEFAARAGEMAKLGVEVEVLDENDMRKLGMGALLGVAQGSARPPRLVILNWKGGKPKDKPIAFIGKGVVFDTGGISIKPAASMEDMKGDMGGAAAVTGLLHTLAARKAKVNAIGILGLVENMPDGNAQRPGDIVTSMSGQTIEIINTDAEGRLVLADALWYCQDRFKPQAMIDLATLTGAIMVALGTDHAGLFSNDDALAAGLLSSGLETQEKLWRMPLGKAYDKMIDSRFADMKNTGGRHGGACTAAQFLQRFVNGSPWAHLDVAGTAMDSPKTEISQSWASGFGVRLLDHYVRTALEG